MMLYVLTLILNALSLFSNRLKKFSVVFSILIAAYLGSKMRPGYSWDTDAYQYWYLHGSFGRFEFGYSSFSTLFRLLGANFEQFRFIYLLIAYIVLAVALRKLNADFRIFYLIYAIFPLVNELTTIRSTMMLSVVLLAMSFLSREKKWQSMALAEALILVAASFHSAGYFYLMLPIIYFYIPVSFVKKYWRYMVGVLYGLIPFFYFFHGIGTYVRVIALSISGRPINQDALHQPILSLGNLLQSSGVLLAYTLIIVAVYLLWTGTIHQTENVLLMTVLTLSSAVFIPFLFYSFDFERMIRFGAISMWILVAISYRESSWVSKKKQHWFYGLVILSVASFLLAKGFVFVSPGKWGYFIQYILQFKTMN